MQSTNSYFNKTLYKKQLLRFWPLWGGYGLIMLMVMPLYYFMNLGIDIHFPSQFATNQVLNMATYAAPWISACAAILGAMAVWSYLYNSRSVGMLHALPIKREGLFFTNYLAGLSFLVLPTLVIFLLTLGVEAIGGVVDGRSLAIWLLCQCLTYLFFFSFATLIAFTTGSLLALPALYVIFNGLAFGLAMLLNNTFANFVYGFQSAQPLNAVGFWLTPLYVLCRKLDVSTEAYDAAADLYMPLNPPQVHGLTAVAGAAVIGLVLAGLALVLYRRRKLEMAGEVVAVPWLRPVFKYGVALCGSLAFGNAFYAMFSYRLPEGILTMLFFLLLWGAVFYFAAEMLLKKSFRVFGKSWRGCVTLLCVIIACVLAMEFDVTGYERSIPAAGDVASVSVNGDRFRYDYKQEDISAGKDITKDPDFIAQVIDLHTALVNGKREVETRLGQTVGGEETDVVSTADPPIAQRATWYLSLGYTMKDGSQRVREYQIPITALLLQDPASPAAKYDALLSRTDWRAANLLPDRYQREDLVGGSVDSFQLSTEEQFLGNSQRPLTQVEAQRLYDAVKEDLAAGRLGREWFLEDEEYYETQYVNDIDLSFYGTYAADAQGRPRKITQSIRLSVQKTATATIKVLNELGLADGVNLWTEGEWYRQNYGGQNYEYSAYDDSSDRDVYAEEAN